jgi:phosphoenolpyruvate-protein phosphotransferase
MKKINQASIMSSGKKTKELGGEVLSAGTAKGTLYLWDFAGEKHTKHEYRFLHADTEIKRFEKELNALIEQLELSIKSLQDEGYLQEADIILAHLYLLTDPQFRKDVQSEIQSNKTTAEAAVENILKQMIRTFEQSESPLFFERASDIRDIITQLKHKLSQQEKHLWDDLRAFDHVIIAVQELTPSLLLEARKQKVTGFIVKKGTPLSHAIILAKSFGLPVVRISKFYSLESHNLEQILIDDTTGRIVFEPSDRLFEHIMSFLSTIKGQESFKELSVNLWINIIDPEQVTPDVIGKIRGVGLYRTEALFMAQEEDFPSEQQQMEIYRLLFERCRDIPVTFRTADIGGDKMLPYFSLGPQENPYLGFRAHRIFRFHPEIFITQLKAVLKAAVNASQLKLLYPMIETTDELFFVQDLVSQAVDSLKREGMPYNHDFQQGIMIEVPSAAWNCREILEYVDFASLGTNDLFQYFFAVDRNNANAYRSYQPENPAAIRMLKYLVETAEQLNKPLSICGEIASSKRYLPLLLGVGFRDISIDVHAVEEIGRFLMGLDIPACEKLAEKSLAAKSSREVNALLNHLMPQIAKASEKTAAEGSDLIDPICGMVVHVDDSYVVEHQGESYYFCSVRCKKEFEKELVNK